MNGLHSRFLATVALWGAASAALMYPIGARADDFRDRCDGEKTSWSVSVSDPESALVRTHRRDFGIRHEGKASEQIVVETQREGGELVLERKLARPGRVIDELTASVWVRSNRPGLQLYLRVIFPNQKEPQTGAVLSTLIEGTVYRRAREWQELTCETTERAMQKEIRVLRAKYQPETIDTRESFVYQVVLTCPLRQGMTEVFVDNLCVGPIVDLHALKVARTAEAKSPADVAQPVEPNNPPMEPQFTDVIKPAAATKPAEPVESPFELAVGHAPGEPKPRLRPPAEIRQGQLEIGGRPRLTIMLRDLGEKLSTFKELHANTVWISDANDRIRLAGLREEGIRVAATPPAETIDKSAVDTEPGEKNGEMPGVYGSPDVVMWMLGTRLPSLRRGTIFDRPGVTATTDKITREEIISRLEEVRHDDYRLRRPILADVVEDERYYSRYVSVLGTSRHIVGTTFSFKDYRKWLVERSTLANPGTNLFTWIQTEPAPPTNSWRKAAGCHPIVIEPEQIRLQLYAAICAGFRGFGYWSRSSLDADGPGAVERRLEIAELNLELELIEPFLASFNRTENVPFRIEERGSKLTRSRFDFLRDQSQSERIIQQQLFEMEANQRNQRLTPLEAEAAVFQGPYNCKLVVATWLAHDAQFCPGKLAGVNAQIPVPEPSESAHFWEVTPTGVRSVAAEKTVGGYRVTLPTFDQTAVILISSDPGVREQVEERVRTMAQTSARIKIDLAKAKLERVQKIDEELTALGVRQDDMSFLLYRAGQLVTLAETAFAQTDYSRARSLAAESMQSLRILQYAYWNGAVTQSVASTAAPAKPAAPAKKASNRKQFRWDKPNPPKPKNVLTVTSTLTSPYTICFQTLPDHWRLVERIGRAADRPAENILQSGNFEDGDAVVSEWTHSQNPIDGVRAQAELDSAAHTGSYALRLVAVPTVGVDAPVVIPKPPVTVISPAVPVGPGQVLYISGWIKMVAPVTGSLDGVTLSDNLGGPTAALRFTASGDWQRFQMLREVHSETNVRLTVSLNGMGELLLDDLQIVPIQDPTQLANGASSNAAAQQLLDQQAPGQQLAGQQVSGVSPSR